MYVLHESQIRKKSNAKKNTSCVELRTRETITAAIRLHNDE